MAGTRASWPRTLEKKRVRNTRPKGSPVCEETSKGSGIDDRRGATRAAPITKLPTRRKLSKRTGPSFRSRTPPAASRASRQLVTKSGRTSAGCGRTQIDDPVRRERGQEIDPPMARPRNHQDRGEDGVRRPEDRGEGRWNVEYEAEPGAQVVGDGDRKGAAGDGEPFSPPGRVGCRGGEGVGIAHRRILGAAVRGSPRIVVDPRVPALAASVKNLPRAGRPVFNPRRRPTPRLRAPPASSPSG